MCSFTLSVCVCCVVLSPSTNDETTQMFQQESFETSSAGDNEEALSNGDAAFTVSEPPSPKTVAEKLELVQNQEADLLRQFEDTHHLSAQVRGSMLMRFLYHMI